MRKRNSYEHHREREEFSIGFKECGDDQDMEQMIQKELELLNASSDAINKLETQLEEANNVFRNLLSDSTHQLKTTSLKLGSCIQKARPYFDALDVAKKAQKECQSAATNYKRASSIYEAAKETVALAEDRFLTNENSWEFDNAWQEMLNHATIKVMEAETQKTVSETEHSIRASKFQDAENEVHRLCKKLSKHADKALPYFEQKTIFNRALEAQKDEVTSLQSNIITAKYEYARSLRNLEDISESIHARRRIADDLRKLKLKESQFRDVDGPIRSIDSDDDDGEGTTHAGHRFVEPSFDLEKSVRESVQCESSSNNRDDKIIEQMSSSCGAGGSGGDAQSTCSSGFAGSCSDSNS